MFLHVTEATYLGRYRLNLAFSDGSSGSVDLECELVGDVFLPLRELSAFEAFELRGNTLAWSNGADFAPEFLRELMLERAGNLS